MAYAIRPFRKHDAAALADLTLAAIRSLGAERYSDEQVAAWASRHGTADRFVVRAATGDAIFVASDADDRPVAYALVGMRGKEVGHVDMLYCHPDHARKGLADELLAQVEHHCRAHKVTRLFTEASELARGPFERAGYTVTHRRDFAIPHEGREVAIHNYAMEKPLT
ncbi:GNAT family N-acetyltransferase [Qipengyuania nanhaisediminis]|uniref:GNAT family N-acetyltransferase n=1 Tax=Qipengyuania nanhaisediminis TaxID=604088 RepID=UPI0038B26F47